MRYIIILVLLLVPLTAYAQTPDPLEPIDCDVFVGVPSEQGVIRAVVSLVIERGLAVQWNDLDAIDQFIGVINGIESRTLELELIGDCEDEREALLAWLATQETSSKAARAALVTFRELRDLVDAYGSDL